MLSARKVVSGGGETGWADMRAAYDALDTDMRERIAGLSAYHSLFHSQARVGQAGESMVNGLAALLGDAPDADDAATAGEKASGYVPHALEDKNPPLRPLVKVHPVTGRPALFIGRHAYGIPGLSEGASEQLLDELIDFACRPPRVLEHCWEVGDLAIWDNRCVLHRARPWDFSGAPDDVPYAGGGGFGDGVGGVGRRTNGSSRSSGLARARGRRRNWRWRCHLFRSQSGEPRRSSTLRKGRIDVAEHRDESSQRDEQQRPRGDDRLG